MVCCVSLGLCFIRDIVHFSTIQLLGCHKAALLVVCSIPWCSSPAPLHSVPSMDVLVPSYQGWPNQVSGDKGEPHKCPGPGCLHCHLQAALVSEPGQCQQPPSPEQDCPSPKHTYEKSQGDCSGCLSLPHLPLLQPPMLLPSITNVESGSGNEKALPKRDLSNFPASPSTAASPSPSPCPSFPWLMAAKGRWCWQGAAACLAGSPGQPARLFRPHSHFPEAGSAEQETGCLGSLTVSKH